MRYEAGRVGRVLRALGSNVRWGPPRQQSGSRLKLKLLYIFNGSASCKLLIFIPYRIKAAPGVTISLANAVGTLEALSYG